MDSNPLRVFIGLGSNLSQPVQQLSEAVIAMASIPSVLVEQVSSCYASRPMGPSEQPDYVNAVAELKTSLPCRELLTQLQAIELQQGRVRKAERWGARTLDLDILLYGNEVIDEPDLIVPHYGMKQREFVIYPLAEIVPELCLPCNTNIQDLLSTIPSNGIKRLPSKIGIRR